MKSEYKKFIGAAFIIILIYECMENIVKITNIGLGILSLFMPFILGAAIAFIINVPMRQIEKGIFSKIKNEKINKMKRGLSLFVTIFAFIIIVSVFIGVVAPEIAGTVTELADRIPDAINRGIDKLQKSADNYPEIEKNIKNIDIDWKVLTDNVISFMRNGAGGVISTGIGFISGIVSGITTFLIAVIFAIYILFSKEKLSNQIKQILYAFLSKKSVERILEIGEISSKTFASFLTGQCLEACILGSMFIVTMWIFRFPYALITGLIIAVTALIPIVGAFIGCVFGVLLIMIDSPIKALLFIVLFLILQQIEGNLIYPHVVGNSVGLPSIWVLMAVTIGGKLMGVIGMVIFIPICSIAYALFKDYVKDRLRDKKIKIE